MTTSQTAPADVSGCENTLCWGTSSDLQADVRYEPNACRGYVMDISLGCPHKCTYCLFSQLELRVHKLQNPSYRGDVRLLKLDRFLERDDFPPAVYMCYSSDPLGNEEMKASTVTVLRKLFDHDVSVLFISKGIFDGEILDTISMRPDLMNIQVGLTNADDARNRYFEPGAPSYADRLENVRRLSAIPGLATLLVRMDPLIPNIDDTPENIRRVFTDVHAAGVDEVSTGYIVLNPRLMKAWAKNPLASKAVSALTEQTPTISGQVLYSIPFDDKLARLKRIEAIGAEVGVRMSVCGCKEERLKTTDIEWICHPFNRSRRQELQKCGAGDLFHVEIDHLK